MQVLHGDGIHDETPAIHALLSGEPVSGHQGSIVRAFAELPPGEYRCNVVMSEQVTQWTAAPARA